MRRIVVVGCTAVVALTMAACSTSSSGGKDGSGSSGGSLTVGLLAPLTGGDAATAKVQQNVVEMAADVINAAGGIDGKKITIKTYDTQLKPEVAAQQAQRAITQDKVVALIGPYTTSGALAVATVVERAKVVDINDSAATPAITQGKKFVFRTSPITPDLASGLVKVAVQLHAKNVVLMYDSGGFGLGSKTAIEQAAKAEGVTIGSSIQYTLGASDVSAQVTKVAQAKPGAVIIAGSVGADHGLIIKTLVEQGVKVPVIGFSPIVLSDAVKISAGAYDQLPGVYTIEAADITKPQYQKLLTDYNAKYEKLKSLPEQVLGAYDAEQFIFDGLKASKGAGGEQLAAALEQLPAREGTNGKTGSQQQFTATKHDAMSGVYVVAYKMVNGVPKQDTSLSLG